MVRKNNKRTAAAAHIVAVVDDVQSEGESEEEPQRKVKKHGNHQLDNNADNMDQQRQQQAVVDNKKMAQRKLKKAEVEQNKSLMPKKEAAAEKKQPVVKGKKKQHRASANAESQHWDADESSPLQVSADRRTVNGVDQEDCCTIRAKHPIFAMPNSQCPMGRQIDYFEVAIVRESEDIYEGDGCKFYIGLCDTKFPLADECAVGNHENSFGLFTDGKIHLKGKISRNQAWAFGEGAVMRHGIDWCQ